MDKIMLNHGMVTLQLQSAESILSEAMLMIFSVSL